MLNKICYQAYGLNNWMWVSKHVIIWIGLDWI